MWGACCGIADVYFKSRQQYHSAIDIVTIGREGGREAPMGVANGAPNGAQWGAKWGPMRRQMGPNEAPVSNSDE
jgi:hypothetical protein